MQLARLGLGLGVELPLQRVHAELVLAHGGVPAPEPGVQAHDGAMDGLLQRIEREEPEAGLDPRLGDAGLLVMGQQVPEPLEGQLVQALPLGRQPLLEGPFGQRQPGQQLTAIEPGDLLERGRPAVGDQRLELRHVHVHDGRVQGHARPVEDHAALGGSGQGLPDSREGMAQIAPCLRIRHVSPQQPRELLARMGLAERQREVGQEGLGLARRENERSTPVDPGLESSEQHQPYPRGHLHGPQY